jgi:soluble lytic murein transglycosylase-like protein
MSITTCLKRTAVRDTEAALSLAKHSRLILGTMLALILPNVLANTTPFSDADNAYLAITEQSNTTQEGASIATTTSTTLGPRMQAALNYVKDRYNVSREAMLPLFEAVQKFGYEYRMDPLLILAVIGVESRFNPLAKSADGAHGLMQIVPRFHLDKVPNGAGVKGFLDPIVNIRVGTRILKEAIERHGNMTAGLQAYSGSSGVGSKYANKVLAEKARLEVAID